MPTSSRNLVGQATLAFSKFRLVGNARQHTIVSEVVSVSPSILQKMQKGLRVQLNFSYIIHYIMPYIIPYTVPYIPHNITAALAVDREFVIWGLAICPCLQTSTL